MRRIPLPFALLALLVPPLGAQGAIGHGRNSKVVLPPCPAAGAHFGHTLAVLEMDGAGRPDVAVGAWGEDAVYVFYGQGNVAQLPEYELIRVFDASGPRQCPAEKTGDGFGYDVGGGQLDGDAADELVVGAPFTATDGLEGAGAAYVIGGVTGTLPMPLLPATPRAGAIYGTSVAVGDFDGDGQNDVAVSAPLSPVAGKSAGRVHVYFGPFDAPPVELVLENPNPVDNGNFGTHLAVHDGDGNGVDDLVVSAIGNTAGGIQYAGQIFVYPGPIDPVDWIVVEDPAKDPADQPSPRFGMHVDARGDVLAIGANRKDWVGVHDAGMGFSALAPGYGAVRLHPHPTPRTSDYVGYRCIVADVVGDATLDVSYIVMASPGIADPNFRALMTWDGTDLAGPPARMRRMLPLTADHFGNGIDWMPSPFGGKDTILMGDPTYDGPGQGLKESGRVVLYHY